MRYAVDRIVGEYVVLENLSNKKIKIITLNDLDFTVNDGDILLYDGIKYTKDDIYKKSREDVIREKMERLRATNND